MLTSQTVIVAVAVLMAAAALWRARATARRLARLSESYWELRYEVGQLRARIARLEVTTGVSEGEPAADAPRAAAPSATTFVPLSSLKK